MPPLPLPSSTGYTLLVINHQIKQCNHKHLYFRGEDNFIRYQNLDNYDHLVPNKNNSVSNYIPCHSHELF